MFQSNKSFEESLRWLCQPVSTQGHEYHTPMIKNNCLKISWEEKLAITVLGINTTSVANATETFFHLDMSMHKQLSKGQEGVECLIMTDTQTRGGAPRMMLFVSTRFQGLHALYFYPASSQWSSLGGRSILQDSRRMLCSSSCHLLRWLCLRCGQEGVCRCEANSPAMLTVRVSCKPKDTMVTDPMMLNCFGVKTLGRISQQTCVCCACCCL